MYPNTQIGSGKRWSGRISAAAALFVALFLTISVQAQSAPASSSGTQSQAPQGQPGDIPDAPSAVQPHDPEPANPPMPRPEEKPPAQPDSATKNPWINVPGTRNPETTPTSDTDGNSAPPPMPPVKTVPPGSAPKQTPSGGEQLYRLRITSNFVQVPVTVKDKDGRTVDGLLPTDFTVLENGTRQKLTFFTSDPFALSVAIVLDLGMPDTAVQKVNQTFPSLVGAFAPYDEVAIYTYSSTVSQVTDFEAASQKLAARLSQMKTERGRNNGPPVLSGPLAPNGPIVNGIPVGSPTQPVYTPTKEAHVLNDAILEAALDLSKRERTRRKIIFVISDGREYGSKASYNDVKRLLLSNEIQVKAVAVEAAALPVYDKIERLHLPHEGYSNILPKYTSATGGGLPYAELSRSAIEDVYAKAMSEARNQYTLGYTPARGKVTTSAYRSIEVLVDRPGLKIYAKDGYYPAPAAVR